MIYDLTDLLEKQKALDTLINDQHHVSYAQTREKRFLALLVELGELANATRTFKFWSLKSGEGFERIIDEYADGLHFLLSLVLAYDFTFKQVEVKETSPEFDLTHYFITSFVSLNSFAAKPSQENLQHAFSEFLQLGHALSFTKTQIETAYLTKLGVNYERQKNNY